MWESDCDFNTSKWLCNLGCFLILGEGVALFLVYALMLLPTALLFPRGPGRPSKVWKVHCSFCPLY